MATADYSAIAGGQLNSAGYNSFIGGGYGNAASGSCAVVGGGGGNTAPGNYVVVAGGSYNSANGDYSTIAGGAYNTNASPYGWYTPYGVQSVAVTGTRSAIPVRLWAGVSGTQPAESMRLWAGVKAASRVVPGPWSQAVRITSRRAITVSAGFGANAAHQGAFVWADSTGAGMASISSTASNQFTVRASGGTRFFSNAGATTGVSLAAGGGHGAISATGTQRKTSPRLMAVRFFSAWPRCRSRSGTTRAKRPPCGTLAPWHRISRQPLAWARMKSTLPRWTKAAWRWRPFKV